MKNKVGKKPDIIGLNKDELQDWLSDNEIKKASIKCQILISICEGNSVSSVCQVFVVTRESIRLWKNIVLKDGANGLISNSYKGRASYLSDKVEKNLKKILSKPPYNEGYKKNKWTGKLICDFLEEKYNIKISIRTAQLWKKKI